MRRFASLLAAVSVLSLGVSPAALAQNFPYQSPTYTPTGTVDAVTCTAACDVVFTSGSTGTLVVRVAGTGTGITGNVQGTEARNGTIAWSNLPLYPLASSATAPATMTNIVGTGIWRVPANGLAQIRVHITAVTGSVSVSMSGDTTDAVVTNSPSKRTTYSAAVTALAPAASATDFFTLTGSATTTVRVTKAECSGISTANATATVNALVRSTANSAGTSTAATAVPHDSNDPAATGTALSYTANPTTGTLVGVIRSGKLTTVTAASTTVAQPILSWDFNPYGPQQEIVLRGTGQVFALNGAGASFSAGAALNCNITWIEDQ